MRRPIRAVVAKPGLHGHDRGAKTVARALKDAGMEVVYTGRHQTVDQIVAAAVHDDVEAVGLSVLSGAHMDYCARLRLRLDEEGAGDVVLVVGGTVQAADGPPRRGLGYGVFGTGSRLADIVEYVHEEVARRRGQP